MPDDARIADTGVSANARTIEAYNAHVAEYVAGSPASVSGAVREWLGRAVDGVPHGARLLELGSAAGRDAAYLNGLGYRVECTDATPAFVDLLRSKGIEAGTLNAITDPLPQGLDVVLADAVLLHFTRAETERVAAKVHDALRPGGRFALVLKRGAGEAWTNDKLGAPRFFCYWTADSIRGVLTAAGFADVDIRENHSARTGTDWLHIVALKAAG
jgi:SAM-dependent methyltransferase